MSIYGYTHAKVESIEKYISEHDIKAILLGQFATMHERICAGNEHISILTGPNKGKCRYCLKKIAKLIDHGLEPVP